MPELDDAFIYQTDLKAVAEEVFSEIKANQDFFSPIKLVFPNRRMALWFKAYWLRNHDEILMNLHYETMNSFLPNLFLTKKEYEIIDQSHLAYLILKHQDDNPYRDYFSSNGEINAVKAYDLASQMASLYLQYDEDCFKAIKEQKDFLRLLEEDFEANKMAPLGYIYSKKDSFKKYRQRIYFLGFTHINNLQKKIISDYIKEGFDAKIYFLKFNKDSFSAPCTVTSAPSPLREVEGVHDEICSLLLKDKSLHLSDFVVVSEDISSYESYIGRVFRQDNKEYPDIPYVISSSKGFVSNLEDGLRLLFEILQKGFFTRADFSHLISNALIKKKRNISDDEADAYLKSIVAMNVFRNMENGDDWEYARRRLLVSKIVDINSADDNLVNLDGDDYLPYISIDLDDAAIIKFISLIDDLHAWLKVTKNVKFLCKTSMDLLMKEFDKWFSMPDQGVETNALYSKVKTFISLMEYDESLSIPLNVLFYQLFDFVSMSVSGQGEAFFSGVSFIDSGVNNVYPAKYVFYLGAGSKSLPPTLSRSELDQRKEEDIHSVEEAIEAFYLQYQSSSHFYASYIYKDLKTDEGLYPTSLLISLSKTLRSKGVGFTRVDMTIDEKRPYKDLFTRKEMNEKKYFDGLLKPKAAPSLSKVMTPRELMPKVSISKMRDFLLEPLSYKANVLFGNDDDLETEIENEFEPLSLAPDKNSILITKIFQILLKARRTRVDPLEVAPLKEEMDLEHILPQLNEHFRDDAFKSALDKAEELADKFAEESGGGYKDLYPLPDLTIEDKKENISFVLTYSGLVCKKESFMTFGYYFPKKPSAQTDKNYLEIYLVSLFELAMMKGTQDYLINLHVVGEDARSFNMSPAFAKEYLLSIYKAMNDFSTCEYLPLKYVKVSDPSNPENPNFYDIIGSSFSIQGSPWAHFQDADLFDRNKSLGYKFENFDDDFQKAVEKQLKFIRYISDPATIDDEEGGEEDA
ncbi:MAG: exodeoxyribonuclease V subunit gamma [Bacilli bacterium]|nr:exodeoxyribonuclease V subunit gamma [Bacilli bacterium]